MEAVAMVLAADSSLRLFLFFLICSRLGQLVVEEKCRIDGRTKKKPDLDRSSSVNRSSRGTVVLRQKCTASMLTSQIEDCFPYLLREFDPT